jgi:hypothetical protein
MKLTLLQYVCNVAIGIDQAVNTILFGYPDETLSARCGRLGHRYPYKFWKVVIDAIFHPFQGPNHCVNAHIKEEQRYHSPSPAKRA